MSVIFVDLLFAGLVSAVSMSLGWWLRGGVSKGLQAGTENQRALDVLARLHDLAARVAADVGEHSSRVEEINEELNSAGVPDTDVVVSAVGKLVEANSRMQQQLASAEERLQKQARQIESAATEARTDVLTGLPNRRALDDLTAKCLTDFKKSATVFSVVMLDVDHFKRFNDTHGHQAGDEVLRRVGGILKHTTSSHAMPARYGGEEFAIVLPGSTVAQAVIEAERVRQAIDEARFRFDGTTLHVTVSLGTAEIIVDEDVAGMIERADSSLYASKAAGRNQTHWHDGEKSWPGGRTPESPAATPESPAATPEPPAATPEPQEDEPAAVSDCPAPALVEAPPEVPPTKKEASGLVAHLTPDAAADATSQNTPVQRGGLCDGHTFCTVLGSRLAEWRRGGVPPSVLLIHIDRYPAIVSDYGTAAGSRVCHTTMQFLRAAIRDMDMVAQYQGTTFALLLPGAGLGNALTVAERLRQAIGRCPIPVGTQRVQFTVSVGGAEAAGDDDTRQLVERAQEALSSAIETGGDCSMFHDGMGCESAAAMLDKAPVR